VPDAPDADHDGRPARLEPRDEPLHRVVGGQAGVRVRRHLGRLDVRRQPQQRPLVDEDVVGEAAVLRQPGELVVLAVHVEAAPAGHAEAAAVRRVEEHGVADRHRSHGVADGVHPARVLVPEHDRGIDARRRHQPVDRVQVGRADAGAADPDDDAPRPVRLGLGPVDQLERAVVLAEERGLHAAALASVAFAPT
jgi:hypothetical protein